MAKATRGDALESRLLGMAQAPTKGRVATLGMFIIDQFQTTTEEGASHVLEDESIGGGGIYAMTCARLFLPASQCAMIIDTGIDFPDQFRTQLESLGREMTWFRPRQATTTRALNMYSGQTIGEGHQSFKYLSPGLQLHLRDLLLPPSPFVEDPPQWVHIVCSTSRATAIVDEKKSLRLGDAEDNWSGNLVWEPMPSSCVPSELPAIIELAPDLAVISPNILELQALLSIESTDHASGEDVEHAARAFYALIQSSHIIQDQVPAIIVRAGPLGSYTFSSEWSGWVPPFFTASEQERVVDPTGGGNGFLGGLCAGLLVSQGDIRAASMYAATAASFAIEQKGLPRLDSTGGKERWNEDDPYRRLEDLRQRMGGGHQTDV